MLSDTKLKNLKAKDKLYKISDRDGLYVAVTTKGSVSFRYDYRINGRRETLTIGRYGSDGISLAEAREKLMEARKLVNLGISPAAEKSVGIMKVKSSSTFGEYTVKWLAESKFADSTRAMKGGVIKRDIEPALGRKQLQEITPEVLRNLCDKIKSRGANAAAVMVREIVGSVFTYAIERGERVDNPAKSIKASSIATFEPRDRALSPKEISILFKYIDEIGTAPMIRWAIRLVLLTMVRKSELILARWDEVDFEAGVWTIPAARMKMNRAHSIYLSRQAHDLFVALKMCAGGSEYVLPSQNQSSHKTLSNATLNRVITKAVERAQAAGEKIGNCTPHDLRRTASTLLHEDGFNSDWIEKCLAHEERSVRAVYNKAEYAAQRKDMLQQWADMVDGWLVASV